MSPSVFHCNATSGKIKLSRVLLLIDTNSTQTVNDRDSNMLPQTVLETSIMVSGIYQF